MLENLRLTGPSSMGLAMYPPGAVFGPRRMHDYEFVWLIEGDAEYRMDGRVHPAPRGSMVLCRPGVTDFFQWDPQRPTRHAYFHFFVEALPESWPALTDWPVVRLLPEGDVLRPMFRHILTWAEQGDPQLRQLSMAHLLWAFITGEMSTREAPADPLPEPVHQALDHIRQALEHDGRRALDLGELAGVACVTPEHLCRLFQRSVGRSPLETVRLARLDRAAVLLARSNYNVREIADLCGFASPFHFSRRFKQAYGMAPTVLRAELARGAPIPSPRLLVGGQW